MMVHDGFSHEDDMLRFFVDAAVDNLAMLRTMLDHVRGDAEREKLWAQIRKCEEGVAKGRKALADIETTRARVRAKKA